MHVRTRSFALAGLALALHVAIADSRAQEVSGEWPPEPPEIEVLELESGIRVIHLPRFAPARAADTGEVDIAFGYSLPPGGGTLEPLLRSWLAASVPARTAQLLAHLGGGEFHIVGHPDLAGVRLRVPAALTGQVIAQARAFLDQRPEEGPLLDYVLAAGAAGPGAESTSAMDRAAEVVVTGLLGPLAVGDRPEVDAALEPDAGQVVGSFRESMGTDRAWVVLSRPPTRRDIEVLSDVRPRRSDPDRVQAETRPEVGDVTLPSNLDGGVVIGSRIASVHYEGWFNTLVVDRTLRRVLGPSAVFEFFPSRFENVHILKVKVSLPDYAEDMRTRVMESLSALQYGLPEGWALPEVKRAALDYLGDRAVLEWFAIQQLWEPLGHGWAKIWNLTDEEFRSAAVAFLRESRMSALWAPAFLTPAVVVNGLGGSPGGAVDTAGDGGDPREGAGPALVAPGEVRIPVLQNLPVRDRSALTVNRLSSGMALAPGGPALFVAGPFASDLPGGVPEQGPNGTLWRFDRFDAGVVFPLLEGVRPDRMFFFFPAGELDRWRPVLEEWNGGRTDATDSRGAGEVATGDLPALIVLKTWLDRKLIEAGWSDRVEIRIQATEGSDLAIRADPGCRSQIEAWLASSAAVFDSEGAAEEFTGLLPAAGAQFDRLEDDLRILLWQRAPEGRVPPPQTVSLASFRTFLEIYF